MPEVVHQQFWSDFLWVALASFGVVVLGAVVIRLWEVLRR